MNVLVTGSAGHLGEALVRTLQPTTHQVTGLDKKPSTCTHHVGSVTERDFVSRYVRGTDAIIHVAALHKPHIVTHSRQEFVNTNIAGTLNILEEAVAAGVGIVIFTSTTSTFGRASIPARTPPPYG